MLIRQATPADAEAIAAVHVASWQGAYRGLLPNTMLDTLSVERRTIFWRSALTENTPYTALCEEAGMVVGFVSCGAGRGEDGVAVGDNTIGEIYAIYLLPRVWSKGYGRALMAAAWSALRERNYRHVALWVLAGNERAMRFYRAVGFAPDGQTKVENHPSGVELHELRYGASLAAPLPASVDLAAHALRPVQRTDEHAVERHATFRQLAQQQPIRLLFLGDSITRRWVDFLDLWDRFFGAYQPANFGVGSDGAEHLLWRVQHGELDEIQPELIVLLIGANNMPHHSALATAATIGQVIATIRVKLPQTAIILMGILPRGPQDPTRSTADTPYYMAKVRQTNRLLAEMAEQKRTHFLDISAALLTEDGEINTTMMPDHLHLVGPGYQVWGEALQPLLAEWMISD